MSTASETLTRDAFREIYGGRKPYFEMLDGHPVQKTLATRLHALVYDPVNRRVWHWDHAAGALHPSVGRYQFRSLPTEISHDEVFCRMEKYL